MKNFYKLFVVVSAIVFLTGFGYSQVNTEEWVARYNGPGNARDQATAIALDDEGNVYVTGSSRGSGTDYDYATIKYNSNGVQQWVARYNGPANSEDVARAIALDGAGNVFVTGESWRSGTNYDYATIKYNTNGDSVWVARYNGPENARDQATAIALDGAGNVYVTGYSWGSGTNYDYATIKYNSNGIQQWVARYNGPGNSGDGATAIALDDAGNVYVTGYSRGSGTVEDYATIKYNTNGDSVWVARYNGPGNSWDYATAIALDDASNVYVTGCSRGSGTEVDYATIKYNTNGIQQWMARYNGPGNGSDFAYAIALDGAGNIYVTGYSWGSGTSDDYATIKYSGSIGIQNISTELPEQFSLSQNYPNPFNPSTTVKYSLPKSSFVTLTVYDILGNEVLTLVNSQKNAGVYTEDIDGAALASGVYYYSLFVDGQIIDSKKMMLVK